MAAEAFGVVSGALSVAALFNNCVNCFEYIQLGRHFGQDFERSLLRVDVAKTRLSRWGEAVAINEDPRFATNQPATTSDRQVQLILEQIDDLFRLLRKSSERYELSTNQENLQRFESKDLRPVARRLHDRLGAIASQRQKNTSLAKKTSWALYDSKNFRKLLDEVTEFVEALEKLVPVEQVGQRLAKLEIEDMDDEESLSTLQTAAEGNDDVLAELVEGKLRSIAGRNYADTVRADQQARIRVGNEWSENASIWGMGSVDKSENGVRLVNARGASAVHVGNSYGGRGILDGVSRPTSD
ncbi:hypothetical protein CcaCcLH18_13551 [Colletotrichum camelliae]|nr:hypothetical protein CcaCcLH18_13551 [Colletotrichum camelliae]